MRLEQVGQFGGDTDVLALNGDRVYLQMGQRVVTVDVSNPYRPTIIARSQIVGWVISIEATDKYVMVKTTEGTIWKFEALPDGSLALLDTDISQTAPDASDYPEGGIEYRVEGGGYVFKYNFEWWQYGWWVPLTVYREGNETEQILTAIGSLPEGETAVSKRLVASGRYVYVATDFGLSIYDLGVNPDVSQFLFYTPPDQWIDLPMWKEIGTLTSDFDTYSRRDSGRSYYGEVRFVGDFMYTFERNRISVWNAQNPTEPLPVKSINRPETELHEKSAVIRVNDSFILDQHLPYGTAHILDTRDSTNPRVWQVKLGDQEGDIITASNDYLIYYDTEWKIFDITDPFQPHLLDIRPKVDSERGRYHESEGGGRYEVPVKICGKSVFIDGLTVIDFSDPLNARQVDIPSSLASDSPNLFTCDGENGLYFIWRNNQINIYSVDNLDAPVTSLDFPLPSDDYRWDDLWYAEHKLYYKTSGPYYTIIDVKEPQVLTAVPWVRSVTAYKDYLYFNMYGQGIGIFKLVPN